MLVRNEIRVVKDVENLRPELQIETLRNRSDVIILDHREIQVGESRADQNVASGVAPQIEALWGRRVKAAVEGIAKRVQGRACSWDCKALGLYVVGGIAGIDHRLA